MTHPDSSQSDRVLLVEGQDDVHVVLQLCALREDIPDFSVKDKKGIEKLLAGISGEINAPEREVVGILVDANDDVEARWRAVTGQLEKQSLQPPEHPEPAGTIIDESDIYPRVGIWLMPDNQSRGEIEDFVAGMIPADDPVWPLSNGYIDGIPKANRKFKPRKIRRAKVHAWLATREEPRLMGAAIRARDLNANAANSEVFADWLRRLFE